VADHPDQPGIVAVRDARGRFLGTALCSPASEIRLRLLERSEVPIDAAWWHTRLAGCRDRRAGIDANAWRAVHAEGDGLPALIVDRYDRWLVVQILSAALETQRSLIIDALREVFAPEGILFRHDTTTRRLEKLNQRIELAWGEVPEQVEVREGASAGSRHPGPGRRPVPSSTSARTASLPVGLCPRAVLPSTASPITAPLRSTLLAGPVR